MKTNQPNRGRRQAFTRGDLLIMVALVLLLVAVQLPTFGKAQSGSQAGTCANNLRRLIQAWGMYADDNHGRLAPNNGSNPNHPDGTWVAGWLDFSSSFDSVNTSYLISSERTGRYGLLGPYLNRDPSAFKCPSDLSRVTILGRSWARVRSVSMNSWMGGSAYCGQTQFRMFHNLSEISRPEPSKAFVILDEREDSINDGVFQINMTTNLVDYPASYHDGGANLAFADGHVGFQVWQDPRTVPWLRRGQNLELQIPMTNNPDLDYLRSVATARK